MFIGLCYSFNRGLFYWGIVMQVSVSFDSRGAKRWLDDVHNAAVEKALPSAINKSVNKVYTRVVRKTSQSTGVQQKQIRAVMIKRKANRSLVRASISARTRTPNLIGFNARQTKRGLKAKAWRKTITIHNGFIGNSGRTAFKRTTSARLPIKPLRGPNVSRAFNSKLPVYQRYASIILPTEFDKAFRFYASKLQKT